MTRSTTRPPTSGTSERPRAAEPAAAVGSPGESRRCRHSRPRQHPRSQCAGVAGERPVQAGGGRRLPATGGRQRRSRRSGVRGPGRAAGCHCGGRRRRLHPHPHPPAVGRSRDARRGGRAAGEAAGPHDGGVLSPARPVRRDRPQLPDRLPEPWLTGGLGAGGRGRGRRARRRPVDLDPVRLDTFGRLLRAVPLGGAPRARWCSRDGRGPEQPVRARGGHRAACRRFHPGRGCAHGRDGSVPGQQHQLGRHLDRSGDHAARHHPAVRGDPVLARRGHA